MLEKDHAFYEFDRCVEKHMQKIKNIFSTIIQHAYNEGIKDGIERQKLKEEISKIIIGDEVASVNEQTGELEMFNTFIVTEIGEDFIGGITSKGSTHFHDEPDVFSRWKKTGKHIDILRVFEPVEMISAEDGEQE